MITTISLQWASDLIEQKYIFFGFKDQKVTPARFTFKNTAQWEANVLPGDEIFVGTITTKLENFSGNRGDFWDEFYDLNTKLVLSCFVEDFEPAANPVTSLIRHNTIIECSSYQIKSNTNPFTPINLAVGYVFHLKL